MIMESLELGESNYGHCCNTDPNHSTGRCSWYRSGWSGWRYAAELDLPAKQYAIEKIGYADDYGYPALRKVALPYTAEDAVLTLWAKKEER